MKKPSFLERITGASSIEDDMDEAFERDDFVEDRIEDDAFDQQQSDWPQHDNNPQDTEEGELPVDMYQTGDEVVIRALVAGVLPADLDISITRDMVVIRGLREENQEAADDDYFHRELFWGSFSRTIILPEEVVIDEADAQEKHGLLEIRLPKFDKARSTKLTVTTKTGK